MPFYEYEHIPGIDWLCGDTNNELPARQLGSVARQLGKKQALTESFAATGWNVSPDELRRIVGFQFVGGVNLLCQHLLPYSNQGVRKHDHPAHFSDINPWVEKKFGEFNNYITRLSYLMTEGEEPVNVAVLHPMRSAYLNYKREDEKANYGIADLEEGLLEACRMLSSRGIAYHFLDETLLGKYGFAKGKSIGCGQCAYSYLVIPHILTMDKKTEKLVKTFIEAGGKALLLGDKPIYLEGEPYSYTYLDSNCTLDEIIMAQSFYMKNTQTELYGTYRVMNGVEFLVLQNASREKKYTQTFCFCEEIKSLIALDLLTLKMKQLPLTITLQENETLLVFPVKESIEEKKEMQEMNFRFANAKVEFEENYLPVDTVQYSTDGIHFSQPMFCHQAFQQLLEKRYEGNLYLKYSFEISVIPDKIHLMLESYNVESRVNGQLLPTLERGDCKPRRINITPYIHLGINEYEAVCWWHQSEKTYSILFNTELTSGFRNAMTYDSEINIVYVVGNFGVYTHEKYTEIDQEVLCGRDFYIGQTPEFINEPVVDGMPFYRGTFTVCHDLELTDTQIRLKLDGNYQIAEVEINGNKAGEVMFGRSIEISDFARRGINELKISYTVGNRNLLGPLHFAGNEKAIGPLCFETFDFQKDERGLCGYKLIRFYPDANVDMKDNEIPQ